MDIEDSDIIYVCHSTNNKNIRKGELKILRKVEGHLYFEFGENEMNIKKRFYDDEKTLEKDFNALQILKEKGKPLSSNNKNMNREDNGRKYNMLRKDEE